MVICVTGSSGTGKTNIAKALARKLRYKYVDVNKIIKYKHLRHKYIKKLDTYEIDDAELNKILTSIIKKNQNIVIDSHLSHYLPKKYVDYCVVCRCDLRVLKKRLEKRKYPYDKIRENLDSEIFDVCFIEAFEKGHKVIAIETGRKDINGCVDEIIKKISLSKSSLPV